MSPEHQLVMMRFQLKLTNALAMAMPETSLERSGQANQLLEEAADIYAEFETSLKPEEPKSQTWVLRYISGLQFNRYVGEAIESSAPGYPTHPGTLIFMSLIEANTYARNANIWKMVEPELLLT